MKKALSIFVALCLTVLLFAGAAAESEPIVLGFSGPLTGDSADFGQHALNGVQVAVNQINANGGLLGGRMLEVVSYDDKNIGEEAASVAELLASNDDICAIASQNYSSGVALVAAPLIQEAGIPAISNSASHPDVTKIGDCIFRNHMIETVELEYAFQMPSISGANKLGIVSMMSDFGESITNTFSDWYEQYKGGLDWELSCVSWFEEGTVDFSANISELIAAGCDTIMFTAEYNNLASFAIQLRKQDTDINIIGLMTCYTGALVELAGDAVEGMYLYTSFNPNSENPLIQSFAKEYAALTNGGEPDFVAANAYDSVMMIAAAITNAGSTDRAAIKDALYTTTIDSTAGKLSFDANGEAVKSCVMFKVENGEFVEIPNAFMFWDDFVASLS